MEKNLKNDMSKEEIRTEIQILRKRCDDMIEKLENRLEEIKEKKIKESI